MVPLAAVVRQADHQVETARRVVLRTLPRFKQSLMAASAPVQTISYGASAPVQTVSYGASAPAQTVSYGAAAGYESSVVETSYSAYTPSVVSSQPVTSSQPVVNASYDAGMVYGSSISFDSGISYDSNTIVQSGYESSDLGSSVITANAIESSVPVEASVPAESSAPAAPVEAPATDETIEDSSSSYKSHKPAVEPPVIGDDAALLTVAIPDGSATVTVNGHPTSSSGTVRQFMSKGLKEGFVYTYVVKVNYEQNGSTKTDSKEVKLRPGDTEQVVFEVDDAKETAKVADEPLVTVVKLNVPADATVNLAGNDTNGSGAVRTFRTTSLKAGQQWTNYTVRVTATVGGNQVSRERTVNVDAGSTTELTFDFDSDDVASR